MALRAITPSQEAYCSKCHVKLSLEETRCPGCGEDFTGVIDAGLCGECQAVVTMDSDKCHKCGAVFKPVKTQGGLNETEYLRRMLQWRGLQAQKLNGITPPPTLDPAVMMAATASSPLGPQPVNVLYQLAEPLEKVLKLRRKRLEQMDELIAEAKQRIDELGETSDPINQKEKTRLKRWIDETQMERENLATIENSMIEMEKVYKNLLALQQVEMQTKEESIRMRLDSVGAELERMEKEKLTIQERETEIKRREDELRKILERIDEKEKELSSLERLLTGRVKESEEHKKKLDDAEKQLEKDKWMAAQRQLQSQLIAMKNGDAGGESGERPGERDERLNQIEERIDKLTKEKDEMLQEKQETNKLLSDINRLLKVLDDLLGQLPKSVISKFANSEDYKLYETVLQKCGV
jgi:ribosomal protein L40E